MMGIWEFILPILGMFEIKFFINTNKQKTSLKKE